jgi:predicted HicB family RNase H-like nuclease
MKLEYKGYTARVEFAQDAGVLFGEVEGLKDVVTFESDSVRGLEKAFHDSVNDYLDLCAKRKEEPEKPYSGKFVMRVDPRIHREISMAASRAGMSLNAFTTEILRQWVHSAPVIRVPVLPSNAAAEKKMVEFAREDANPGEGYQTEPRDLFVQENLTPSWTPDTPSSNTPSKFLTLAK